MGLYKIYVGVNKLIYFPRMQITYIGFSLEVVCYKGQTLKPFRSVEVPISEESIVIGIGTAPAWETEMVIDEHHDPMCPESINDSLIGLKMGHVQHRRVVFLNGCHHFWNVIRVEDVTNGVIGMASEHVRSIRQTNTVESRFCHFSCNDIQGCFVKTLCKHWLGMSHPMCTVQLHSFSRCIVYDPSLLN